MGQDLEKLGVMYGSGQSKGMHGPVPAAEGVEAQPGSGWGPRGPEVGQASQALWAPHTERGCTGSRACPEHE